MSSTAINRRGIRQMFFTRTRVANNPERIKSFSGDVCRQPSVKLSPLLHLSGYISRVRVASALDHQLAASNTHGHTQYDQFWEEHKGGFIHVYPLYAQKVNGRRHAAVLCNDVQEEGLSFVLNSTAA